MRADYFKDRRIWITGASSGIGAACAEEFARRGARVALSSRSRGKLEDLAARIPGGRVLVVPVDVTSSGDNRRAVQAIGEAWGGLDTAFLNAGDSDPMDLDQFDAGLFQRLFDVNVVGMARGIEAALPELLRSTRGHLVGMSSSVAYRGMPRAEAYCGTKAAVRSMLQGLRCQLRPRGVPVTIILPGFVKSDLTAKNEFHMPFLMETPDAARRIADGMERLKTEVAFPAPFIWMLRAMAALPDSLYTNLMARRAR